jgi:hypothetical protein
VLGGQLASPRAGGRHGGDERRPGRADRRGWMGGNVVLSLGSEQLSVRQLGHGPAIVDAQLPNPPGLEIGGRLQVIVVAA